MNFHIRFSGQDSKEIWFEEYFVIYYTFYLSLKHLLTPTIADGTTDSSKYATMYTCTYTINYSTYYTYFIPTWHGICRLCRYPADFPHILLLGYFIQHNKDSKWIIKLKSKVILWSPRQSCCWMWRLQLSEISCHVVRRSALLKDLLPPSSGQDMILCKPHKVLRSSG